MRSIVEDANELGVRPLTRLFRALADETRLRIVALLAHGELCVCHLETALELSQPNVSRGCSAPKRALRADHAKLKKSCGPGACR